MSSPTAAYNPSAYYPSFTITNLSIRKGLFEFGGNDVELKIDVANLFDVLYGYGDTRSINRNSVSNPTYYWPGRSVYAGLVVNF